MIEFVKIDLIQYCSSNLQNNFFVPIKNLKDTRIQKQYSKTFISTLKTQLSIILKCKVHSDTHNLVLIVHYQVIKYVSVDYFNTCKFKLYELTTILLSFSIGFTVNY